MSTSKAETLRPLWADIGPLPPTPPPPEKAEPSAQPLTCQPLLIWEKWREDGRVAGKVGRGVWRLPIRRLLWSPNQVCPPVREEASTLTARESRHSNPKTQPRAVFDTQSDSGLPLWLDLQGHRQVSLRLGGAFRGSEALIRACVTKVDQQKEGLEGAPGHLLQAAFLMASVSHFSISSPQTTASCSGLCICHLRPQYPESGTGLVWGYPNRSRTPTKG